MVLRTEHCSYTPCYCEENVYKLIEKLLSIGKTVDNLWTIFISNKNRKVPIFYQISAVHETEGTPMVVWDYHVILMEQHEEQKFIWDLDSSLDFPCELVRYYTKTIRPELDFGEDYKRFFRMIPARLYLDLFSSNRSHMLKADGVSYMSPPPSWPIIWRGEDNLQKMISMEEVIDGAEVYSQETFRSKILNLNY